MTLGKTRIEASWASNPLVFINKSLQDIIKKDAPMIHRKGETMMDQSVTNRSRLKTPKRLLDQNNGAIWKWTTNVYVAEDSPPKEG